jgi:ascorbate-specific PTS system EIIC-type component UlaA
MHWHSLEWCFIFLHFVCSLLVLWGQALTSSLSPCPSCIRCTCCEKVGWGPAMRSSWGVLGGLTTWVRIDFGVVFLVFLTVLVLRRRLDVRWAIVTGCIAMAIISPWFLYVYTVTSSWLPPSGSAQSSLITLENAPLRLLAMGKALLSHLTPWIYSWSFTRAGTVASITALLSLVAFLGYLFRQKDIVVFLSSWLKQQPHLLALLIGTSVLLVGYLVFFGAWNGYVRYTAPLLCYLRRSRSRSL